MRPADSTNFFGKKIDSSSPRKLTFLMSSLLACSLSVGMMASASAATIYVNLNAPGGDGKTWAKAFKTVGAALNAAASQAALGNASNIYISQGSYQMPGCNQELPNNVNIYGGYVAGSNTRTPSGNLFANTTILTTLDTSCYLFALNGTTNTFDGITLIAPGAIRQSGGKLNVVSSSFSASTTAGTPMIAGGAIVSYNGAILTVNKSVFQNTAAAIGGAIASLNASSIKVTNSMFSGNQARGLIYRDTRPDINQDIALSGGGAINVDGNFSYQYIDYGPAINTVAVVLQNNTYENNHAAPPFGGGAVHVANAGTVSITGSTFGALDTNGVVIPGRINSATLNGDSYGGAISLSSSNVTSVTTNNFFGNTAFAGGAVYSDEQNVNSKVTINTNRFVANTAIAGGAICDRAQINNSLKTMLLTISGNTFADNSVTNGAGPAIYYDNTQAKINGKPTPPGGTNDAIDSQLIKNNPTLKPADIAP